MKDFIVIYVTVGAAEEAGRIARALVEDRLAACVNQLPSVRSTYRWQGEVEQSNEELLIIKTRRDLLASVHKRVRELHSYELPELIALPVVDGSVEYLQWLDDQLTPRGE
jgi:periplasmic divalent cation tolerance protein